MVPQVQMFKGRVVASPDSKVYRVSSSDYGGGVNLPKSDVEAELDVAQVVKVVGTVSEGYPHQLLGIRGCDGRIYYNYFDHLTAGNIINMEDNLREVEQRTRELLNPPPFIEQRTRASLSRSPNDSRYFHWS